MLGACRLNNKSMRGLRHEPVYQCMAIDLAMLGVISKEECEMLIGSGIPKGLVLPNGKAGNLVSEKDLPEQPVETEDTEDTENTEGTEDVEDVEDVEGTEDSEE